MAPHAPPVFGQPLVLLRRLRLEATVPAPNQQPHTRIDRISVRLLDVMDSFFYALVGVAFLAAAAVTLVYAVVNAYGAISMAVFAGL